MSEILYSKQRAAFKRDGFVVYEKLIPGELVSAARTAVESHLGIEIGDPLTWGNAKLAPSGWLSIYHQQALWDIRQYPDLYEAFKVHLDSEDLLVNLGRVVFRPPVSEPKQRPAYPFHWDIDPLAKGELLVQGQVYLSDIVEYGAFACVPSTLNGVPSWAKKFANEEHNFCVPHQSIPKNEIREVYAPAGSLVIWDSRLLHTGLSNAGSVPRITMWISMTKNPSDSAKRESVRRWIDCDPPSYDRSGTTETVPPAILTPLGRFLVGGNR